MKLFADNVGKLKDSPDGKFYGCFTCGLSKHAVHPRLGGFGRFMRKILIVSDYPSLNEDFRGEMWNDDVGKYFKNLLRSEGVDLQRDCKSVYAVQCIPKDNTGSRPPKVNEIRSCTKKLDGLIKQYKPRLVILLGSVSLQVLYGQRWKKGKFDMNKWQGWAIPDQDLNTWVVPLQHPRKLYQQKHYSDAVTVWKNELDKVLFYVNEPVRKYPLNRKNVEIIDTERGIFDFLELLQKQRVFVWDIETTGLKPYKREQHEIKVISFAWGNDKAYVIPMPKVTRNIVKLKTIFGDKKIRKIAHNMKFENLWAAVWLGVEVKGWYWDTMQVAHILNNTPGIAGLKFQTFVRFGIPDYDSEVAPYLKADDDKDSHAVNHINDIMNYPEGREKVMVYCGYDSLNTWRLYQLQKNEL